MVFSLITEAFIELHKNKVLLTLENALNWNGLSHRFRKNSFG